MSYIFFSSSSDLKVNITMQRYFYKDKDGQMTTVTEPLLNEVST